MIDQMHLLYLSLNRFGCRLSMREGPSRLGLSFKVLAFRNQHRNKTGVPSGRNKSDAP